MKKIILFFYLALSLGIVAANAQSLAINTTGATANLTSILDVSSTGKGVLIPRMSSVQRTGIGTPANGLLVYDTDSIAFSFFNGGNWVFIKTGSDTSAGWSITGNNVTSANFLGTTNDADLFFKRNNINAGYIKPNNTAFGVLSGNGGAGTNNTAFGFANLAINTTGSFNTGVGYQNLYATTPGSYNTGIGFYNLRSGVTGNYNTAIGARNIEYTTGEYNVAIGAFNLSKTFQAGQNYTKNIAIGYGSMQNQIYGRNNIAIGEAALNSDTTSFNNIAIGYKALFNNENKNNLVAIGDSALYNNSTGSASVTQGADNTALGSKTLSGNTIGYGNTATGSHALNSNTNGDVNVANGAYALNFNTSGDGNTAMGFSALYKNTTGNANTGLGYATLYQNTTGYSNVAIGASALYNNTTRSNLVAIGDSALYNNVGGNYNTAVGSKALFTNTSGNFNTANGFQALYANTTGYDNTATGFGALITNTTGNDNTANGIYALRFNTTGNDNTANGRGALFNNISGSDNIADGSDALYFNTTGSNNVAVGVKAGSNSANDNGYYNTYIGDSSMMLADRTNSTVIGSKAYTTTNNSMVLGSINGVNGATADVKVGIGVTNPTEKLEIGNGRLRFRGNAPFGNAHGITWTNNAGTTDRAFIGMETDNFLGIFNFGFPGGWNVRIHNSTGEMGINKQPGTTASESRLQVKQASVGASNGISIETAINTNRWDMWVDNNTGPDYNFSYNGSLRGYIQNATGNYIVVSDKRFKKDVIGLSASLSNLNQLKAYQYHYFDNSASDAFSIGFMAQDVQKLFPDAVSEKLMEDGKKRLGVNYQYFTVLAIKGLQEQQENMQTQNKKIENLEKQIAELKKLIEQYIKK